jgi:hypothetical protein
VRIFGRLELVVTVHVECRMRIELEKKVGSID